MYDKLFLLLKMVSEKCCINKCKDYRYSMTLKSIRF